MMVKLQTLKLVSVSIKSTMNPYPNCLPVIFIEDSTTSILNLAKVNGWMLRLGNKPDTKMAPSDNYQYY